MQVRIVYLVDFVLLIDWTRGRPLRASSDHRRQPDPPTKGFASLDRNLLHRRVHRSDHSPLAASSFWTDDAGCYCRAKHKDSNRSFRRRPRHILHVGNGSFLGNHGSTSQLGDGTWKPWWLLHREFFSNRKSRLAFKPGIMEVGMSRSCLLGNKWGWPAS